MNKNKCEVTIISRSQEQKWLINQPKIYRMLNTFQDIKILLWKM